MVSYLSRLRTILRLVVYALPTLSLLIADLVFLPRLWHIGAIPHRENSLLLLFATTAGWIILADHYGVSSFDELFLERSGMLKVLKSCTGVFLFDAGVLVLGKVLVLSRAYLVVSMGILVVLALLTRLVFRILVGRGALARQHSRVLMVGAGSNARRVSARLRSTPLGRGTVVGYLRLPGETVKAKDAPVIEMSDSATLNALRFDEIVIAVLPQQYSQLASLIRWLEVFCKPIRTALDFGPKVVIRERLFQIGRLQLVDLATTPAEGLAYTVVKRGFDLLFASLATLLVSPVLVAIAVLVKLSSPGPIFFRQVRVGMDGRQFDMLKFRTMRVAPKLETDSRWRSADDPRITPIGALLRRASLDELPQLFNVLRGDMSLVGPRPERPQFVTQFKREFDRYNARHRVKVGITGLAQVNGLRGDTSIRKRLQYDLYYQQNWSLALDVLIILKTLKAIVVGENAY